MFQQTVKRGVVALAAALGLIALAAAPAAAHVTVNPNQAPKGGYAVVSFRVPDEDDTASTTKVEVDFDPDVVIPSARVRPVPGWDAAVETRKLVTPVKTDDGDITDVVSRIVWTAQGDAKVQPGQFQQFDVSLGPLPTNASKVVFKALQTYDNGTIVRWIDTNPNAEHPAPVLTLTKATAGVHSASSASAAKDGSSDHVKGIAIGALVVGVIALLLAGVSLGWGLRSRAAGKLTGKADKTVETAAS